MDYGQVIKQLESARSDIQNQVDTLEKAIAILRSGKDVVSKNPLYADFSPNWGNGAKIAYVLRKTGRFAHIREISQTLLDADPSKADFKAAAKSARHGLDFLKLAGKVKSYRVRNYNRAAYWGSVNWFDENGLPKNEYFGHVQTN